MGFLCPGVASPSSSLLCEENMDGIFECNDSEGELPELGMDDDLDSPAFPVESDEIVASLMEREKEQLTSVASGRYLQRLNSEGPVSSWRTAGIDWINKTQAHLNFGPLCFYVSINYLDRFFSKKEPPVDRPWMQQLLPLACLSIAAKMEETWVPRCADLQVCSSRYTFQVNAVKRAEVLVMNSLKWRMQAVTPFSYINYFMNKFTKGKPLSCGFASRYTELILGTLKGTKFLEFMPSEISAAVVLSAAAESYVLDFSSALIASNIPVDKENVRRCHEAMQEVGLVKIEGCNAGPSLRKSPSGVLDVSCLGFKTDDDQTLASSSQANNHDNQAYAPPANRRTRLDA
ncbi:Cyclin-D2-2 [Dichanthelium oligosanthes]|uniref:Cyclin-D2-2 n=1 Tax=Dichanthelium oligosanthes TaxID=888268 RepID=A0A1E5UKV6_9POAL|nr:Cyclin-D2-2 [Dichanthelium oligosanthes]